MDIRIDVNEIMKELENKLVGKLMVKMMDF